MADLSTIDILDERIAKLERNAYGNSSPDPDCKCIESLINVQNRLQSAVTGRDKITMLFSKLDDLEKYLNPAFRENVTLTETAKLNLVLLEEDRIRNTVDSLQTVKDLIQYLDSEHIKATPSLVPKLYEVTENQIKLQEEVSKLAEETKILLANYNDLVIQGEKIYKEHPVTSLSKQFILWDSMLTEIEKEKLKTKTVDK